MSPLVGFQGEGYSKFDERTLIYYAYVESPWILWLRQLSDV